MCHKSHISYGFRFLIIFVPISVIKSYFSHISGIFINRHQIRNNQHKFQVAWSLVSDSWKFLETPDIYYPFFDCVINREREREQDCNCLTSSSLFLLSSDIRSKRSIAIVNIFVFEFLMIFHSTSLLQSKNVFYKKCMCVCVCVLCVCARACVCVRVRAVAGGRARVTVAERRA